MYVISPFDASTFDPTANIDTSANTITLTAHNLVESVNVTYSSGGGTDIGGIVSGTDYFVHVVDANTIQLAQDATSLANQQYVSLTAPSGDASHTLTPVTATVTDILYYFGGNGE